MVNEVIEAVVGGVMGYVTGRLGLGSICILPAVVFPELEVMGMSAFLVSTVGGYEGVDGERGGVEVEKLGLALVLGLGYGLLGQLFGKSVFWSLLVYGLGVTWMWLRGEWVWGLLLLPLGMAICHTLSMPIYGIFAGCSLARLWVGYRQEGISSPEASQLATVVAGVIPGVSPQFFCKLLYGSRFYYEEVSALEPYYEWGAVVSYLLWKIADGKTVMSSLLWGTERSTVLIAALVALGLAWCLPQPKVVPSHRLLTLIQAVSFWIVTAIQAPAALFAPVLIALTVVILYPKIDLQYWLIPAYVVGSLI